MINPTKFVFLFLLVTSTCGAPMFESPWIQTLFNSINQMNSKLHGDITSMNQQIQNNVQEHIKKMNSDLNSAILNQQQQLQQNNVGEHIMFIGGNKQFSSGNIGGTTFFQNVEQSRNGNILHRREQFFNPKTQSLDTVEYTLDLSNPNAKPVYINKPK